ncbi:unnamed protein product [Arctogadus glacialis]
MSRVFSQISVGVIKGVLYSLPQMDGRALDRGGAGHLRRNASNLGAGKTTQHQEPLWKGAGGGAGDGSGSSEEAMG